MRLRTENSFKGWHRCLLFTLAALCLLCPGQASVLCIAPGGHIAVEELNAECCTSSHGRLASGTLPGEGITSAGRCRDCVDFLMMQEDRGAVLESSGKPATDPVAKSCKDSASEMPSPPVFGEDTPIATDKPPSIPPLRIPLRC